MSVSPDLVQYLESIVYGNRRGFAASVVRGFLYVLSGLYRTSIWLYLLPFNIGLRKRRRLSVLVISVGNLTVGGTGKTPVVQYLSKGFAERKWMPAVLSYGYGGALSGKFGIVSDRTGVRLTSDICGDEPAMLASDLPGIPVLVCKDRGISGQVAIDDLQANILLLDDGFQVWKLHRDFDILLMNADTPFDNGRTLPAGKLREPVSALKRANCVIVTGDCKPEKKDGVLEEIRSISIKIPVFFGSFKPSQVANISDGTINAVESIKEKRVLALSAIAKPNLFEDMLAATGAVLVGSERFPDHHLYSAEDVQQINRRASETAAELIATTDKDAVKLKGYQFAVPVISVRRELELDDEDRFWNLIINTLRHK